MSGFLNVVEGVGAAFEAAGILVLMIGAPVLRNNSVSRVWLDGWTHRCGMIGA
jgi:hypothetical protein